MSSLNYGEKLNFEKLFGMSSGYVLYFSNASFYAFFNEVLNINIYDDKYNEKGESKAHRLRTFWEIESDNNVSISMQAMLKTITITDSNKTIYDKCIQSIERIKGNLDIENLEVIKVHDETFKELVTSIKQIVNSNPNHALDRMHTYTIKFLRSICQKNNIANQVNGKDKPLHSLMGEYIKNLQMKNLLKSDMSKRILKNSISLLESFNDVRNTKSLAHDNSILEIEESILILNQITACIKFIETIENQNKISIQKIIEDDFPF